MQRWGGSVGLWRCSNEGDSCKSGSIALVYGDAAMGGTATSWGALPLVGAALWRGFKIQARGVSPH
jgi:hypothetical protein